MQTAVYQQQGECVSIAVSQLFAGDERNASDDIERVPGLILYINARPEHLSGMSASTKRIFLQADASLRRFLPQQVGQLFKHNWIRFHRKHGDS